MCPWDTDAPASISYRQTGSRRMKDLKRGDTVQLTMFMLQTKYQIIPTYTGQEIFYENLSLNNQQNSVKVSANRK